MLTAQLKNDPSTLLNMVRHHAQAVEGIVLELLATIPLVMGADNEEWTLRQSRVGANSFSLHGPNSQYHFRGYHGYGAICVYDKYKNGNLLIEIHSRTQARTFIESLV
jgi:hypothetical protein